MGCKRASQARCLRPGAHGLEKVSGRGTTDRRSSRAPFLRSLDQRCIEFDVTAVLNGSADFPHLGIYI